MEHVRRILAVTTVALSAILSASFHGRASEIVPVFLDQATLIKLPERVATLIVGNPLIADVAVQAGGTLVVTGKGYGATNLIALDRQGHVLMEKTIQVEGPRDNTVVVFRGAQRETYSCLPVRETHHSRRCQRLFLGRHRPGPRAQHTGARRSAAGALRTRGIGVSQFGSSAGA